MEIARDNWEEVKELFDAALQQPPLRRMEFVAANASDLSVRAFVEKLLHYHEEATTLLSDQPSSHHAAADRVRGVVFKTGDVLARRFRVTGFVARGGMGEVYEAEDLELRQTVALKTIRQDVMGHPQALERFKREVCFAKAVTHPNICRIFDFFRNEDPDEGEGVIFVSMEMLRGETLADRLRRLGRMSRFEAEPVIHQMCLALEAAHSAGVIHRDFKPANVVLVPGNDPSQVRAVVTDFGIAFRPDEEFTTSSTPAGCTVGTPEWMSPEQLEGRPLTAASDIYSLGLVMYRMTTGVHPFSGDGAASSAMTRLKKTPRSPKRLVPGIPASWDGVILKCLDRDPARRFAKAAEVRQALQDGSLRLPRKLLRRTRFIALAAGLLIATVLATLWAIRAPVGPKAATFHWQRQVIQRRERLKTEIWRYGWHDLEARLDELWLCGSVWESGGGGDLGRGILMHSTDGGASWTEIDNKAFKSGAGRFLWGSRKYSWHDVGPIQAISIANRLVNGATGAHHLEIWVAATSGIYISKDDGQTWQRSTPRPDDRKEGAVFAHISSIAQIDDFKEVYSGGWLGIAHWSDSSRHWQLQLPTYDYNIAAVSVNHRGYPYKDFWAVGGPATSDRPYDLIYHLKQPDMVWERLTAKGIHLDPGQGLSDIKVIDATTGFACGSKGVILRGTKDATGAWTWNGIDSPTQERLTSIEYNQPSNTLWIVGTQGVVLESKDLGSHWQVTQLHDEDGGSPELFKVRSSDGLWILGNGVVYKRVQD